MNRNIIKNRANRWAIALTVLLGFAACSTDDADGGPWVDPRYRNLEDSYTIAADGSDVITFEIKSDMEWLVYNTNEDWCTISPDAGEADITTEVTITYDANTDIDDRYDTFYLKSDYWVFKEVSVTQKGVAMLGMYGGDYSKDYYDATQLLVEQADYSLTFTSNQDWSVECDDLSWFRFTSSTSGTISDKQESVISVDFQIDFNSGERRSANVYVFDRNHVLQGTITVTQSGKELSPEGDVVEYQVEEYTASELSISINSTVDWYVQKASDDSWYSFDAATAASSASNPIEPDVDEPTVITLTLNANTGTDTRAAMFYLLSVEQDDDTQMPVIAKAITIKQAANGRTAIDLYQDSYVIGGGGGSVWYDSAANDGAGGIAFTGIARPNLYSTGNEAGYGLYEAEFSNFTASDGLSLTLAYDSNTAIYVQSNFYMGAHKSAGQSSIISATVSTDPTGDDFYSSSHILALEVRAEDSGYQGVSWYLDGEQMCSVETSILASNYSTFYNIMAGTTIASTEVRLIGAWYTAPTSWDVEPKDDTSYAE